MCKSYGNLNWYGWVAGWPSSGLNLVRVFYQWGFPTLWKDYDHRAWPSSSVLSFDDFPCRYAAPPPAYSANPAGYGGWVPPTHVFPDMVGGVYYIFQCWYSQKLRNPRLAYPIITNRISSNVGDCPTNRV